MSVCAALVAAVPALAQDAPAAPAQPAGGDVLSRPAPSVDELMKRLETLEDRNRELEARVTDLTREQGEEWLGEQRAGQIRDIVRDVLADSDQRASLRDGGMTAGWNDGFFLASPDGRFRLNVGGFVQTRFIWSAIKTGPYNTAGASPGDQFVYDREQDRYGFDVPDLQLWADGHIFSRDFQYMVKARFYEQLLTELNKGTNNPIPGDADFSGFELMDAWVRVNLDDNWSVRAGQFRSPFSRGFLVLEQYQMSASRSVVDYHYALGYTQGVELEHMNDEVRLRTSINNGANDVLMGDINYNTGGNSFVVYPTGTYGGQNSPYWNQNTEISFTGRFDWKPAGSWEQFRSYTSPTGETFGLLTGLGLHYQRSQGYQADYGRSGTFFNPNGDPTNEWFAATIDAQANYGGASLYGALFYNYLNSPGATIPAFGSAQNDIRQDFGDLNIIAAQMMGAVYLMPKVEAFGRYEFAYITGYNDPVVAALNSQIVDADPLNLLTIGVNCYLDGQDLKWTTDFGLAIDSLDGVWWNGPNGWRASEDGGELVFRSQLQLRF